MSWFGSFGVGIFMLISCFYMVDFGSDDKDFSLVKYLKRRLWRLWPCYAVCITITEVVIHIAELPNRMSTWTDWILNLFFVNGFIGTAYVDGAHWYLKTLIAITVIIGIAKTLRIERKVWFYILWMGALLVVSIFDVPYVSDFIGGSYIAYVCISVSLRALISYTRGEITGTHELLSWSALLLLGIVGVFAFKKAVVGLELVVIIPLFLGCVTERLPIMENKLLLFLGTISYPLYLIHQNIIFEIEYYLMKGTGVYSYAYGVFAILIALLLATLLYYIFEKLLHRKRSEIRR